MTAPSTEVGVFLAGAGGAIGRRLVPQLIEAGYRVHGTTRSAERAREIAALGAAPVIVDVLDRPAVTQALKDAAPAIVVHQLTDLPQVSGGPLSEDMLRSNARLREEGTAHLVEAALLAGARRFVAQSVAWLYAPGPEPHRESDPLDVHAGGRIAISLGGIRALERLTLNSPPIEGTVLRYGQLYGPGTWNRGPNGSAPVHVDAAAHAALRAVESRATGVFNIAEEAGFVSAERARRELGWTAEFRLGAPREPHG